MVSERMASRVVASGRSRSLAIGYSVVKSPTQSIAASAVASSYKNSRTRASSRQRSRIERRPSMISSLARRSRTAPRSRSRASLPLFFIAGYALMRKTASPSSSRRKNLNPANCSTSLSCGSEVRVQNTTGRPRAAARNAIWLARMVFPPPGVPVTISVWRLGIPPPKRRSRFGMPVSKRLFPRSAMGPLPNRTRRNQCHPCSRRATKGTKKQGRDHRRYHLRPRCACRAGPDDAFE